ncbi:hypothetical protein J1N35_044435 [Gossypium stocksii]|uniref:Uncharacterized protein n=1 Tax=Gossypium stocksii TaxID=47602 RepID=A0A9D3U914_9ROSI|nr:hypothetical protein J1N35_044435 [Gossypium stocksii]
MGDFNEIAFSHKKQGGRLHGERGMEAFRVIFADCNLSDLGFWVIGIRGSAIKFLTLTSRNVWIGVAWVLDNLCKVEVQRLWTASKGDVFQCLDCVCWGLSQRVCTRRQLAADTVAHLQTHLDDLSKEDLDDDVVEELVIKKMQLNMEIDKSEQYWE